MTEPHPDVPEAFWELAQNQLARTRRAVETARRAAPLGFDTDHLDRCLTAYEAAVEARDFARYDTALDALRAALLAVAPHVETPATLQ